MFGFRPDGRRVSSIDPIVGITPYLMPMRCDAQVFLQHRVDYELLTRYIAAQAAKGEKITFMQIITAAFVRTVSQHPEINRFILNKQFFARNMCAVSFTMLKNPQNAEMGETAVKVKYDLTDTIYDVRDRMEKVINANRGEDKKNFADKLAKAVLVVPGLATGIVALVRLLDRYGSAPAHCWTSCPSIPACISPTTLPSACITSTTTSTTSVRLRCSSAWVPWRRLPWWRRGRRA